MKTKKILSVLLTILMVIGVMPIGIFTASAAEPVSYLYPVYNTDGEATSGIKEWKTGSESTVTSVTASDKTWGTASATTWYVVDSDITNANRIECNGNVNLILKDGCTLTASAGITVTGTNSLTVYGQESGTGELKVTGSGDAAGIGGDMASGSNITINGGTVTATGGDFGAGIGGGDMSSGSNITINGGTVTATGGNNGAGIGGGDGGNGSYITINGGTVTANGGSTNAAGVGSGYSGGTSSEIKINKNLVVRADGNNPPTSKIQNYGTDLTSSLAGKQYVTIKEKVIYKGVKAYNKTDGSFYENASSGVKTWDAGSVCNDYTLVTADDTIWGTASATTWYVVDSDVTNANRITCNGNVNLILKDGCTLTANKGITVTEDNTLTVYGQSEGTGELKATGSSNAAGIGGNDDIGSNITINGGTVTATGGYKAAGIGGGKSCYGSYICVNGGTVTATGGDFGAGIGGGDGGNGSYITINGGKVTANGVNSAAGIGGGDGKTGSNIRINGGVVIANASEDASGIGGGCEGSSADIYVTAEKTVKAGSSETFTDEDIIENDGVTSIAGALSGKQYVKIAQEAVEYLAPVYKTAGDPESGIEKFETLYCEDYTEIKDNQTTTQVWTEGWYVVSGEDVNFNGIVQISNENVNLILKDGAKLTVTSPIVSSRQTNQCVTFGMLGSLSIYGQKNGTGSFISEKTVSKSVHSLYLAQCSLTVNGGNVISKSITTGTDDYSFAYGLASVQNSVILNGGSITATTEGKTAYGLYALECDLTINGGTLELSGNNSIYSDTSAGASTVKMTKDFTITAGDDASKATKISDVTNDNFISTLTAYKYAKITDKQEETYGVTVSDGITNGSVTVDKDTAAENETVTVTATPVANYMLDTLTVSDGTNTVSTAEGTAAGTYTFSMPAKDVTVSATFAKIPTVVKVDGKHIKSATLENEPFYIGTNMSSAEYTTAMDKIKAKYIPFANSVFGETNTEGKMQMLFIGLPDESFIAPNQNYHYFLAIKRSANSSEWNSYYCTVSKNSGSSAIEDLIKFINSRTDIKFAIAGDAVFDYKVTDGTAEDAKGSISFENAYYTAEETVTVNVTPEDGYVLKSLSYTDGTTTTAIQKDGQGKYTFKMPAKDVTVKAVFKNTNGVYYVSSTGNDSTAVEDDETKPFATVQAAVNYIGSDSGTIKLLSDVTFAGEITVSNAKDVIFDLNGYTYDCYGFYIYGESVFTLKDSSNDKTGKLVCNNSKYTCVYAFWLEGKAKLNITSGAVSVKGSKLSYGIYAVGSAEVTISGGAIDVETTINNNAFGVFNAGAGKVTVNAGSMLYAHSSISTYPQSAIYNCGKGNIEINGGTIKAVSEKGQVETIWNVCDCTIDLNGGEVIAVGGGFTCVLYNTGLCNITVTNCKIDAEITVNNNAYCIDNRGKGKITVNNGSEIYVHAENVTTAISAIRNRAGGDIEINGGTIKAVSEKGEVDTIWNTCDCTINLNGGEIIAVSGSYTCGLYNTGLCNITTENCTIDAEITGNYNNAFGIDDYGTGTITVKDGSRIYVHSSTSEYALAGIEVNNSDTVIVNGGTIEANSANSNVYAIFNCKAGTVKLNGGTLNASSEKYSAFGVYLYNGGFIEINGTTFNCTTTSTEKYIACDAASYSDSATVKYISGTFNSTAPEGYAFAIVMNKGMLDMTEATDTDLGGLRVNSGAAYINGDISEFDSEKSIITTGYFTDEDVKDYLTNDYKAVANDDTTYTLKVVPTKVVTVDEEIENGTVSVGDVVYYAEGEEVIVTLTPDAGYELDTLTATYNDGEEKSLDIADNKFTMPAYAVTVSATFKKADLAITDGTTDLNGSVDVQEIAQIGDEVTVEVNANAGYELDTLTATYNDGTEKSLDTTGNKFTMPAYAVTVSATFKKTNETLFNEYKAELENDLDKLGNDSIVENAKIALSQLSFSGDKSLDENKADANSILVNAKKDLFNAYKDAKKAELDKQAEKYGNIVNEAKQNIDAVEYDGTTSLDDAKASVDNEVKTANDKIAEQSSEDDNGNTSWIVRIIKFVRSIVKSITSLVSSIVSTSKN